MLILEVTDLALRRTATGVYVAIALTVLAICPALYGYVVHSVRRREASVPLPPPPPMEQIPPAVVNLLLGGGEVTPKAIETTAVALAAAGWLRPERKADGTRTVRWNSALRGGEPLRPFEERLRERVRQRAGSRVDRVPVAALGPGDGDEYWVWWRGFQQSVREEALALGLLRPGRDRGRRWAVRGAGVVVWLAFLYVCWEFSPRLALVLGVVTPNYWLTWTMRVPRTSRPWLSAAGRRAAKWWRHSELGTEHRLPARQDAAKGPESALPVREPRQIWSSYGGAWHIVETAPLDAPKWGRLWNLVLLGLAACTICAATVTVFLNVPIPISLPVPYRVLITAAPLLLSAAAVAFWLPSYRRIQRVPAEAVFRGAVISRWDYTTNTDDPPSSTRHYCCSVEDPGSRQAWSFQMRESRHGLLAAWDDPVRDLPRVGDVVDVRCSPRRHRMHRITVVKAVSR